MRNALKKFPYFFIYLCLNTKSLLVAFKALAIAIRSIAIAIAIAAFKAIEYCNMQ